jgi:putative flippase GtrA
VPEPASPGKRFGSSWSVGLRPGWTWPCSTFNVLHVLAGAEPLAAKSVSTVTAAVVAFVGNRQWSFASGHGHELRVQVARYVAVTAVGLGLALAPIAVAR